MESLVNILMLLLFLFFPFFLKIYNNQFFHLVDMIRRMMGREMFQLTNEVDHSGNYGDELNDLS